MTKKLTELFELPDEDKELNQQIIENAGAEIVTQEAYSNLEKIENAKAKFFKDLTKKNILVIISGATENPRIYEIAQERIRAKLIKDYEEIIKLQSKLESMGTLRIQLWFL